MVRETAEENHEPPHHAPATHLQIILLPSRVHEHTHAEAQMTEIFSGSNVGG